MPRYFFNSHDGRSFHDDSGTELEDDDAARLEAARLLGAILQEEPEHAAGRGIFAVSVKNVDGSDVVEIAAHRT